MSDTRGVVIIGDDAVLKGDIENARNVEVHGYVEGRVSGGNVMVARGGRLFGEVRVQSADVRGTMQGDVRIQNHIAIRSSGTVNGTVRYGRLSMEEGADLSAHMRNVPPSISGDLDLSVKRGQSARITRADLSAEDPDDSPANLSFRISNARAGHVCRLSDAATVIDTFTQAELRDGSIGFRHDGSAANEGGFDVVVSDADGATSGAPRTVRVGVRD